jgi:hypothetical protein
MLLDVLGKKADFGVGRQAVKIGEEDERSRNGSSHCGEPALGGVLLSRPNFPCRKWVAFGGDCKCTKYSCLCC